VGVLPTFLVYFSNAETSVYLSRKTWLQGSQTSLEKLECGGLQKLSKKAECKSKISLPSLFSLPDIHFAWRKDSFSLIVAMLYERGEEKLGFRRKRKKKKSNVNVLRFPSILCSKWKNLLQWRISFSLAVKYFFQYWVLAICWRSDSLLFYLFEYLIALLLSVSCDMCAEQHSRYTPRLSISFCGGSDRST